MHDPHTQGFTVGQDFGKVPLIPGAMMIAEPHVRRRCSAAVAFLWISAAAAGCGTLPFTRNTVMDLRPHYILAHEDGHPVLETLEPIGKEIFSIYIREYILRGIDGRARQAWAKGEPLRILVFVHGGLNGYAEDFDRMEKLLAEDSPFQKTSYYPIFINWNAALGDSILDDLVFIRLGQRMSSPFGRFLGFLSAPFVFAGRLAQSVINAPSAWWANYDNFQEGLRSAREEGSDPDFAVRDVAGATVMLPARAAILPVLQAFGTPAWEIMKRRAELLVASRLRRDPAGVGEGAARILISHLKERIVNAQRGKSHWKIPTEDPNEKESVGPVEVTLVGHSMGALVVNRILAIPDLPPVTRIIYLAAASSIDEFEQFVFPYLTRRKDHGLDAEVWAFTLSRLREAREVRFYHVLPRGTLLVWIDNYFEPSRTPGQQRFGRFRSYQEYYDRLLPGDVRMVRLDHNIPGAPRNHGDFDEADVFERILCTVDPGAFPADCKQYPLP